MAKERILMDVLQLNEEKLYFLNRFLLKRKKNKKPLSLRKKGRPTKLKIRKVFKRIILNRSFKKVKKFTIYKKKFNKIFINRFLQKKLNKFRTRILKKNNYVKNYFLHNLLLIKRKKRKHSKYYVKIFRVIKKLKKFSKVFKKFRILVKSRLQNRILDFKKKLSFLRIRRKKKIRRRYRVRSAVKRIFKKAVFRRRPRMPFRFRKKGRRIRKEKRSAASNKHKKILGRLLFRQSKNNLFFTMLDTKGHVYLTYSCGRTGLKGPRRTTPYAALQLGRLAAKRANKIKILCYILLKTHLTRRIRSAITGFSTKYRHNIRGIIDSIPRPHNGMRKRKLRNL